MYLRLFAFLIIMFVIIIYEEDRRECVTRNCSLRTLLTNRFSNTGGFFYTVLGIDPKVHICQILYMKDFKR